MSGTDAWPSVLSFYLGRSSVTKSDGNPSIGTRGGRAMKPVQIVLLVIAGALGGALLTRTWHKPKPAPPVTAEVQTPVPAPVEPAVTPTPAPAAEPATEPEPEKPSPAPHHVTQKLRHVSR